MSHFICLPLDSAMVHAPQLIHLLARLTIFVVASTGYDQSKILIFRHFDTRLKEIG
jgi:hypothetical protein